ncbi:MAG: hypothetical protein O7D30_02850, partial [Rickettsia endosymbiont of Ixodes persulcatus]|nr:hypothetical protein [Rickettsia endosymbiont of Ixodes persulcatus]
LLVASVSCGITKSMLTMIVKAKNKLREKARIFAPSYLDEFLIIQTSDNSNEIRGFLKFE